MKRTVLAVVLAFVTFAASAAADRMQMPAKGETGWVCQKTGQKVETCCCEQRKDGTLVCTLSDETVKECCCVPAESKAGCCKKPEGSKSPCC